jgi:hypothetical protein
VVLGTGTEVGRGNTYEQGESGGGGGSKEMDGCPLTCPLTSPPLQRCGITMCEDLQEVARSALVKGIDLQVAALMC